MEKVKENISVGLSTNQVKRLSIVDSIDSLSLFTYNDQLELLNHLQVDKSTVSIREFLETKVKEYGDIEYRLYYTGIDFEVLPRSLFLYGNENTYVNQLLPAASKGFINFVDRCSEEQLVIIYPVSTTKDILFREAIRGLHTYHISTAFIKSPSLNKDTIFIYCLGSQLFYFYKTGESLQFLFGKKLTSVNNLEFQVNQMLHLYNSENLPIILCGNLERISNREWINNESRLSILSENDAVSLSCIKF